MGATNGVTPLDASNVIHKLSDDTHTGKLVNYGNIEIEKANLVLRGGSTGAQYLNILGQPTSYAGFVIPFCLWQYAIYISTGVYRLPYKLVSGFNIGILIPDIYCNTLTIVEDPAMKDNVQNGNAWFQWMGTNFLFAYLEYTVITTQGANAYHDASVVGYLLLKGSLTYLGTSSFRIRCSNCHYEQEKNYSDITIGALRGENAIWDTVRISCPSCGATEFIYATQKPATLLALAHNELFWRAKDICSYETGITKEIVESNLTGIKKYSDYFSIPATISNHLYVHPACIPLYYAREKIRELLLQGMYIYGTATEITNFIEKYLGDLSIAEKRSLYKMNGIEV